MGCKVPSQAVLQQLMSILNTNTELRRDKYARRSAAVAFMLICGVAPVSAQFTSNTDAVAQPCSVQDAIRFRGLSVRLENDLFVDTDQNYTNGVAFTAVSHDLVGQLKPECLTVPVRLHAELIQYLNPSFWADPDNPAQAQNVVVKFGQSMFTPKDPTQTALILDDRPLVQSPSVLSFRHSKESIMDKC